MSGGRVLGIDDKGRTTITRSVDSSLTHRASHVPAEGGAIECDRPGLCCRCAQGDATDHKLLLLGGVDARSTQWRVPGTRTRLINSDEPCAAQPAAAEVPDPQRLYLRAFMIATINPKSVAGYLAAFSQFIQPDLPVMSQMWVIVPTALALTSLSYVGYCALGAGLGRTALNAVFNTTLRRIMAACFIIYGALLGTSHFSKGT